MDKNIISLVKKYCQKKSICRKAIILHGSQAVEFANENSDYDFLIVTDNYIGERIDVFITNDKKKVQVEFMESSELIQMLQSYEETLFKQILDLNLLAGRVLMSNIIEADMEISQIIKSYQKYRNQEALIRRYVYTATNFFGDSKTDDVILRKHSYQMAAINIGTAILIKNNIFWLHIKWQHRFLEKILPENLYHDYLLIRWPQDLTEDIFLKISKELIAEII